MHLLIGNLHLGFESYKEEPSIIPTTVAVQSTKFLPVRIERQEIVETKEILPVPLVLVASAEKKEFVSIKTISIKTISIKTISIKTISIKTNGYEKHCKLCHKLLSVSANFYL